MRGVDSMKIITVIVMLLLFNISNVNANIIMGDPNGKVTLVEFYDYQCPHCKNIAPIIAALIKNNPNLRVIYRPIAVLNTLSTLEATSALVAAKHDDFYNVHKMFMTNEITSSKQLIQLTQMLNISLATLQHEMQSPVIQDELQENTQLFYNLGATHIPLILIGNKHQVLWMHSGEASYEALQHECAKQSA